MVPLLSVFLRSTSLEVGSKVRTAAWNRLLNGGH